MFQYAYARALQNRMLQKVYLDSSDINNLRNEQAREKGWIRLCDKREYQLNHFLISLPEIDVRKVPKCSNEFYGKSKFFRYCKELRLLPNVYLKEIDCGEDGFRFTNYQNYYVEGNFFNKCHYEGIEEILRQEFQLKHELHMPDVIDQILRNRNTVSLHIRRGDFLRVGRNISEGDYYKRAVDYMRSKIEDPYLFIFSDDMEWVKEHMEFDLDYLLIRGYGFSDCEELVLMSMCKHNIAANSTFSYWGAWLNPSTEKIVTAPRGWRLKIIPDSWALL